MDHRHLHPNEIDLLLDGDAGFGLAPLKAHVRRCPDCAAQVEDARRLVQLLDELPHFAPAPFFADRVMARVQVFEPWHVTLRDSVRRWMPQTRPMQALAGAAAATVFAMVSVAAIALLGRLDVVAFAWGMAVERGRGMLVTTLGEMIGAIFGPTAVVTLAGASAGGLLAFVALFLAALVGAALLLRAATTSFRRQRI